MYIIGNYWFQHVGNLESLIFFRAVETVGRTFILRSNKFSKKETAMRNIILVNFLEDIENLLEAHMQLEVSGN